MKIYTKTGDKGKTTLYGGQRILKSDLRVETYGFVDELNSLLGVVISVLPDKKIKNNLLDIQSDLLDIGSSLANPKVKKIQNLEKKVMKFENDIDQITKKLPPLTNFILPGGSLGASMLHFARTVCRRVERRIVSLSQKETIDFQILVYFNRLSDLLFTYARYINLVDKNQDVIWKKNT